MSTKKFLIALAFMSGFIFSPTTFDENFSPEIKVYAATNEELAQQKIKEGDQFLDNKNYQGAISKFKEAIKLNPNDSSSYNFRGIAYLALNDFDNAIKDFSKAIKIDPNYSPAYLARGQAYFYSEKYNNAISDYTSYIKLNPKNSDAYFFRGKSYVELTISVKSKLTMADLLEMAKITPTKLNYHRKAIKDFEKAIELNPTNAGIYFARGSSYISTKDFEKALADFNKAIELNPNYASAYISRGICYGILDDMEKANLDFEKAKELGYGS